MTSAVQHRLQQSSLPDIDGSNTLRGVHLVAGDGKQVTSDAIYIQRHLPRCLYAVGVEIDVRFGGDLADLFYWLEDAGFIVGHHDGDESGIFAQSPADIVGVNLSPAVHRYVGDFTSHLFQVLAGIQHGVMFDGRRNNVVAGAGESEDSQVVAFGATAGKHDLGRTTSYKRRQRLAGSLNGCTRVLSMMVDGGRVAEALTEVGTHRVENLGEDRRGGVIVEVDSAHRFR